MKLQEALSFAGESLEEMAMAQVTNKVKQILKMGNEDEVLSRLKNLSGSFDPALIKTLGPEEKKEFDALVKDPEFQKVIAFDAGLKSKFDQLSKMKPAEAADKDTAPPTGPKSSPDPLKTLDEPMKAKLAQMQNIMLKAKTPADKQALVAQWTKDKLASRLYTFGLKQGVFKA